MARASKVIDGDVQVDPFMDTLASWIRRAISGGEAVKISAITEEDPEFDAAKSDVQREKFHAMIGDINKTGVIVIPGRRIVMSEYDADQCKALLVMWFANEKAQMGEPLKRPPRNFLDPISGQNISVRPSTKEWGKKLTCEFVEFLYMTGSMSNTKWSEPAMKEYQNYREAKQ